MGPPSLDFPPQPVELDPLLAHTVNSRTLPGLSTSSPNAWEATSLQPHGFGEVSFASSNSSKAQNIPVEGNQSRGVPLHNWYEANDGPWVHLHKVLPNNVQEPRSQSRHTGQRASFAGRYRQSHPSDAASSYPQGFPPSDSGYETRRSIANTSVFSGEPERDQDCHSLVGHIEQFQPFHGGYDMPQRDGRTNSTWTQHNTQPVESVGLICPTCQKPVKTPSEMKYGTLKRVSK
jgi:hypothetical protein